MITYSTRNIQQIRRPLCNHLVWPSLDAPTLPECQLTGDSMSIEVLAQQELSTAAVETLIAELGIISHNTLSNLKSLHIFANCSYDANGFMT
jgi:hypothetical protein